MLVKTAAMATLALSMLTACQAGVRSDTASTPAASAGPASAAASSPQPAPAGDCPLGTYRLTAITSKRGVSTPIGDLKVTAGGGGITMTFGADGTWRLSASGSQPLTLETGGISAQGTASGEVRGRYVRIGDSLGFQQQASSGEVTVRYQGSSRSVPMDEFATALAPSGVTTATCTGADLTLTSETVDLTLVRTGSSGSAGSSGSSGVLTITGTARPRDEECQGRKVVVESTATPVRLRGDCPSVEIRGRSNTVDIDRVDEIVITGSGNTVTWSSGLTRAEPAVQPGNGNTVRRK
jgi:hypothetical protein